MQTDLFPETLKPVKRRSNVTKLRVYKNKLASQAEKEAKDIFKYSFKTISEALPAPDGYVIVAWDEFGKIASAWSTNHQREMMYLPEMVKSILSKEIDTYTMDDE